MSVKEQPVLGRGEELASLDSLLNQGSGGRGGVVLLRGDPGIGKSRLARAAMEMAEQRGFLVTSGRAWEFADAPPGYPLWPCLLSLGLKPGPAGFSVWEEVMVRLRQATTERPILWVLEDLHAADEPTLEFLCFLSQSARGLSFVLVLTARARDSRVTARARRLIDRLSRDVLTVDLGPLSAPIVGEIATAAARRPLSAAAVSRLVERAGGNPFFAVEMARAFRSGGGAGSGLPITVSDLLAEQLAGLPTSTMEVLSAGAVMGRSFTASGVGRLLERLPARVIDEVTPALRSGFVEEEAPGKLQFTHILTHEAVYRMTPAQTRVHLHSRAEAMLSSQDDGFLMERAHHALASLAPGREEYALAIAQRAASTASDQGAHDRAYALARGAAAVRTTPPTPEDLLTLARYAQKAGQHGDTLGFCREIRLHPIDPELRARAALVEGATLRPAVVDDELVTTLSRALAGLGETGNPGLRCRLRARLAAALQPALDPMVPIQMARDAVEEARLLGESEVTLEVLFFAGAALTDLGPIHERMKYAEELRDLASKLGDTEKILTGSARLILDLALQGEFSLFDADLDAALHLARSHGHPRLTWRPLLLDSMRALARGDTASSERCLVEVEQLSVGVDDPGLSVSLIAHQHHRARMAWDEKGIRSSLDGIHSALTGVPDAERLFALICGSAWGWMGDRKAAAQALQGGSLAAHVVHDHDSRRLAAEAVAAGGSGAQALFLLSLLGPDEPPENVSGHIPVSYDGPTSRLRGLLHASLEEWGNAEKEFRVALDRVRSHRFLPWVAVIAGELSGVLDRSQQGAEAEALHREALEIAHHLNLPGLISLLHSRRPTPSSPEANREEVPLPTAWVRPRLTCTREGGLWAIQVDQRVVRQKDSRGLQLLVRLLENPEAELHVLALASDEGGSLQESDAGEAIDAQAVRAYRERLREIEGDLEEGGPERDALHREKEFLTGQLAAAMGLRGLRRQGSVSERARINVQRRIRDAIRRIGEVDPALGAYLDRAVATGTWCSFRP